MEEQLKRPVGRPRKLYAQPEQLDTEVEKEKREEEGISINRMVGNTKPKIVYSFNPHFNI